MVTTRAQYKKLQEKQRYLNEKREKQKIVKPTYNVSIDFDYASRMWKKNKEHLGNGYYVYICGFTTKKGTPCKNKCYRDYKKCYLHKNK